MWCIGEVCSLWKWNLAKISVILQSSDVAWGVTTVQVLSGALLQQTFVVEFTVHNQMCDDCHRVEAKDYWRSCVQLRQKVCSARHFTCLLALRTPSDYQEIVMPVSHRWHGQDKTVTVLSCPCGGVNWIDPWPSFQFATVQSQIILLLLIYIVCSSHVGLMSQTWNGNEDEHYLEK